MPTKIWNTPSKAFTVTGFDDGYFQGLCDEWERPYYFLLRKYVPAGSTIIDIGANIGVTAFAASSAVDDVDVIAFEPAGSVFEILKTNIEQNRASNIVPIRSAVGNKSVSHIAFHENSAWGSINPAGLSTAEDPPCVTLDEFIIRWSAQHPVKPIKFVKIDVEGFEWEVIEGMENLINALDPIVQVEFNIWCLIGMQDRSVHKALEDISSKFRYVYRAIAGNSEMPIEAVDLSTREGRTHYIYAAISRGLDYDDLILSNKKLD
ncbi:FkbM family methyltransferase [Rhizorhabdus dicambivorans]|uniref:Methyltransferase FkbM domain-containing protein n=1 Tax=Rhizorhabdus dicambivorans TaxID=1850238 RepID=A0A2A4FS65_9SPHN|nr:FkbM family methyltransferase [Rhizorhabdus dicambivorans]ATE64048.1 hypothetical protein CMV14_06285 [Rhizorhabdus dicambivorans]PCE40241.1 hypothetical protein COO09_21455 [Rhizorhabdus dicambivorans]